MVHPAPFRVSQWFRSPFGSGIGPGEYSNLFGRTLEFSLYCQVIRYPDDVAICSNDGSVICRADPADTGDP